MRRALRLIPPSLGVVVGILWMIFGASSTNFECVRATGRCVLEREALAGGQRREFPIDAVREVRFVDGLAKHKTDGETVLVFANGGELRFARARSEAARPTFERVRAFFVADGPATLAYAERGGPWGYVVAGVILLGSIGFGVSEWRKPLPARAVRGDEDRARGRRRIAWSVGAIAVLGVGQLVLVLVSTRGEGTLVLECTQRCRFQGGECLPGGSVEASLEPGEYPIEIWASAGKDLWIPRRLTIRAGETTTYRCAE